MSRILKNVRASLFSLRAVKREMALAKKTMAEDRAILRDPRMDDDYAKEDAERVDRLSETIKRHLASPEAKAIIADAAAKHPLNKKS